MCGSREPRQCIDRTRLPPDARNASRELATPRWSSLSRPFPDPAGRGRAPTVVELVETLPGQRGPAAMAEHVASVVELVDHRSVGRRPRVTASAGEVSTGSTHRSVGRARGDYRPPGRSRQARPPVGGVAPARHRPPGRSRQARPAVGGLGSRVTAARGGLDRLDCRWVGAARHELDHWWGVGISAAAPGRAGSSRGRRSCVRCARRPLPAALAPARRPAPAAR